MKKYPTPYRLKSSVLANTKNEALLDLYDKFFKNHEKAVGEVKGLKKMVRYPFVFDSGHIKAIKFHANKYHDLVSTNSKILVGISHLSQTAVEETLAAGAASGLIYLKEKKTFVDSFKV